ncbi:hypothetical protein M911_01600 [Ectothiorhodospira haloalkaliphila]|uniref:Terminase small subunit n=1 Tax=Ectothiorhodospira haloalkaliphila TaxID=421628 RepID=W8KYD6_9GAMM|nr:DUF1441 family protein [Ectothiorhodospira haloalkaliphila]AHK80561.1 hypothetical protein M911_01600 [Ectothiorhodospira haloalkaliphila]
MTAKQYPTVSIRALSKLTGLDRDYILRRIEGVQPAAHQRGHPVYRLTDVLPPLTRPAATPEGDEVDPGLLNPTDRRAWYDSELKRRQLQTRDRELIPVDEVQSTVARAFSAIAQHLLSLPDTLERKTGMTGEAAEVVETIVHESMNTLADDLASLDTGAPADYAAAREWLLRGLS